MVGGVHFSDGTEDNPVPDNVMREVLTVMNCRGIPNIAGDDPAVTQTHGKLVIVVPEEPAPQAADADQPRKKTVLDQAGVKDIPNPYILPGRAAVPVGLQNTDLLLPQAPVSGMAVPAVSGGVELFQLPVPDIVFILPRRKVLPWDKAVSVTSVFKYRTHV
jgi:hypothetical protein